MSPRGADLVSSISGFTKWTLPQPEAASPSPPVTVAKSSLITDAEDHPELPPSPGPPTDGEQVDALKRCVTRGTSEWP